MEDAADSKSAEVYPSWGFESPLRHQAKPNYRARRTGASSAPILVRHWRLRWRRRAAVSGELRKDWGLMHMPEA